MGGYATRYRRRGCASVHAPELSRLRTDAGDDLCHRRARPEHPDRLQRPDLARPRRVLCCRRLPAAILMHRYGVPYWATLPPAGLICFVIGVLFGLPALRFEGPYLALVTLAMALATPQLLKYFDTWTGGQQGINLAKPMPPAGLGLNQDRWLYLIALVALLLAIRVAAN